MALKNLVTLAALIGGGVALVNLSTKGRGPSRGTAAGLTDEALADSPNPAERLQRENLTGSPIGAGTPMAASGAGDDLFGSDSPAGETARTPGLADFTRGA